MADARPAEEPPGFELAMLLFAGFRSLIDELHEELARQGHSDVRPAHGFAMQAIGSGGATSSELGRRLGISKQAAGKTVDRLASLGYVARTADESDGRRKLIMLTPHGIDALTRSAIIFDALRARWIRQLGAQRLGELESCLRAVVTPEGIGTDVAGWFGP